VPEPASHSPPAELHLAAILQSSDHAIVSKTIDGIITSWNPAAEKMFGYSAAEAVGSPISIIVPPQRCDDELELLARLRRGESSHQVETTRVARDGHELVVSLTAAPIRDASGSVIGATAIMRDITSQRMSLNDLRMERDRLRITLASIGDAVIVTDARGFIDFVNPVAARLTGWSTEEAKGKPLESVFCIINETTRQRVESPAARAMSEGVIVGLANHTLLVSRDGAEVAIDDSAAPIRDDSGKVLGVVLVFRDVTAMRAIDSFRERLSAIIESSDDAIIGKDLTGRITSWNRGAERIFGYSQQEALGRPITMLIPPERLGEETEILRRIRAGERVDHFETVRIGKDRRKVDVSLTISPIRDSEGSVVGASKIARDITGKKESERELARTHQQLKEHVLHLDQLVAARTTDLTESVLDLETFASSLSHDLRAPLRTVYGLAASLKEDHGTQLNAEANDLLGRILESCEGLSQLVDTVLSYMRIRNEHVRLESISLDAILHDIVTQYPHLQEARPELQIERPLLNVMGSRGLITQMVVNLISNAVKFVSPGTRPKVRLWTERRNGKVRLWIEDNGIGVSAEDQRKIFQLFSRADAAEAYEGSGVGLALVQRAARRLGGGLGIDPAAGGGSRFWIEFTPADPEPSQL